MSAQKIKIPSGWGVLRKGTVIQRNDTVHDLSGIIFGGGFTAAGCYGYKVGWDHELPPCLVYIRRKPKTRKAT